MTPYAFEARNVSQSFGVVQALRNVSLGIAEGEVHAIIGENGAGKSTLMNIFCGKLHPTAGELYRNGSMVVFHSPIDAQQAGVGIAPQEVSLVPNLSVFENILLGAQRTSGIRIDWKTTRQTAIDHLHSVDDTIDPDTPVQALSKAQQQLVQIARAAATEARILIFDEPTAALTYRETEKLYTYIRNFRKSGGSVFYISHRLDEILELSDRNSVLRDGEFIVELDPKVTTKEEMVNHMVGREVSRAVRNARPELASAETVLNVTGLSREGEFEDVSFDLRKGEILGVSGLVGAGRTEVAKCIFGLTHKSSGKVELFGEDRNIRSPADAIRLGLVYLPEERKQEGIFPLLSIAENMAMPNLDRFRGLLHMRTPDMLSEVQNYVDRLKIKIGNPKDRITSLSGGNQQKVIIGRWLMKNAKILIMDEPTRGIDVNAKFEIQRELRRFTESGLSIIFISSEIEEVIDVSDRIMVMHEGRVKGLCDAREATPEQLMQLAMS
ncbi:MAG: sugar ABC transporter ATP-binding protein [Alphaproteobacteria bacterium]|nr:sugar ABC transporter ATP-binding protein [Alphaproteobacteria bacterium]